MARRFIKAGLVLLLLIIVLLVTGCTKPVPASTPTPEPIPTTPPQKLIPPPAPTLAPAPTPIPISWESMGGPSGGRISKFTQNPYSRHELYALTMRGIYKSEDKVDSAGNLYQCITGQGRIIVLNALGIPVANVVVPGRDDGKSLRTTNLAFKHRTSEGYITTSGQGGAWIYTFKALAEGLTLFSHRGA